MKKQLSEMTLEELWKLFPIILTEHKEYWEKWFTEETNLLKQFLIMDDIARISHIGSTAIHEIWAKPIVDILIEIRKEVNLSDIKLSLIKAGYICMNESRDRMSFNKCYTLKGFADKVFHLHLRREGDNDELYFRDYLNNHFAIAKEYELLKLTLWKKYDYNRDAYTEHKKEFITLYTNKAKELYYGRY